MQKNISIKILGLIKNLQTSKMFIIEIYNNSITYELSLVLPYHWLDNFILSNLFFVYESIQEQSISPLNSSATFFLLSEIIFKQDMLPYNNLSNFFYLLNSFQLNRSIFIIRYMICIIIAMFCLVFLRNFLYISNQQ